MADELVDGLYSIKCVRFSLYSLFQHEESFQNNLNKNRYFNNSCFQSLRALFCILQENEMRGSSPPERRSNINLKLFFRRLRVLFRAPMIKMFHVSVLNYSRSFGAIFRLAELVHTVHTVPIKFILDSFQITLFSQPLYFKAARLKIQRP